MKISVFGLGYVGCISATCLAKEGHTVIGDLFIFKPTLFYMKGRANKKLEIIITIEEKELRLRQRKIYCVKL